MEQLFGKHDYRISPLSRSDTKRGAPPLMLLYGSNGFGKTTVLRLLWHLFSPGPTEGHRAYLRNTPFRRLEVRLGNGEIIRATKQEGLIGSIDITVALRNRVIARQPFPAEDGGITPRDLDRMSAAEAAIYHARATEARARTRAERLRDDPGGLTDEYVDYLQRSGNVPVLLADDRKMHFDSDEPARFRRARTLEEFDEAREGESQLAREVYVVLRRVSDWLRQSIISSTEAGSESVDDVYQRVLTQVARAEDTAGSTTTAELRRRLQDLEERAQRFTQFGIFPKFDSTPFVQLLRGLSRARVPLVASVLDPYISGQDARLDKLQPIEQALRSLVDNLNNYLIEKSVHFTLQRGLVIHSDDRGGRLRATQLSSGERQLLLLLCNAVVARSGTGLFLIDEPELSLNAKWQRTIVQSLLDCVKGANVQFIMATHSVEIITRHRQFLAKLEEEAE